MQTSAHLVERKQVRFPRSKRRRIRKKWSKRMENWRESPSPYIYQLMGRTLVMHPAMLVRLREVLDQQQRTRFGL